MPHILTMATAKRTKAAKKSDPNATRRARLIAIWWDLRDALGGDGWEGWSDEEIVKAMDSWVGEPVAGERAADELLEAGFDPRDVRGL